MNFFDFFEFDVDSFNYTASDVIEKNTLIEVSPCLDIPLDELQKIQGFNSEPCYFTTSESAIFPFGYLCSNSFSSKTPNCKLIYSKKDNALTAFSNRRINKKENLTYDFSQVIIADSMAFNVFEFMKIDKYGIELKPCEYGRGVFAMRDFAEGETIEVVNTLKIPQYYYGDFCDTKFSLYQFGSDLEDCRSEIALGFTSLYNHSDYFNASVNSAKYRMETDFSVVAHKDIKKGEQIFISYGYNPVAEENKYFQKRVS